MWPGRNSSACFKNLKPQGARRAESALNDGLGEGQVMTEIRSGLRPRNVCQCGWESTTCQCCGWPALQGTHRRALPPTSSSTVLVLVVHHQKLRSQGSSLTSSSSARSLEAANLAPADHPSSTPKVVRGMHRRWHSCLTNLTPSHIALSLPPSLSALQT
jgi:hypothetical protein